MWLLCFSPVQFIVSMVADVLYCPSSPRPSPGCREGQGRNPRSLWWCVVVAGLVHTRPITCQSHSSSPPSCGPQFQSPKTTSTSGSNEERPTGGYRFPVRERNRITVNMENPFSLKIHFLMVKYFIKGLLCLLQIVTEDRYKPKHLIFSSKTTKMIRNWDAIS